MDKHTYGNWHQSQSNVSIDKEFHKKLMLVRENYRKKIHINITIGDIIECLINNDSILVSIYNNIESDN